MPAGCAPSTLSPTSPAAATPGCAVPNATSSDAPPALSPSDAVIWTTLLTPVTRPASRGAHNSPRPFPTFRQTIRVQQPPRRRKTRYANVLPVLPQQVKQGQLMLRPLLPGPVNYFGPGTESSQRRSHRSRADCLQFSTPPAGSSPQPVHFQRPVRRQLADGTLDAARPVPGAGIAQSLRGQADGGGAAFWKTAGGAFRRPAVS